MNVISAGGVVFRKLSPIEGFNKCKVEILMMKDRFGRWSLPKGKVESGESLEETALREIEEEIGLKGSIVAYLGESSYEYELRDRWFTKAVKYYLVEVSADAKVVVAPDEVIDTCWVSFKQAYELDIYDNVREILRRAEDVLTRGN